MSRPVTRLRPSAVAALRSARKGVMPMGVSRGEASLPAFRHLVGAVAVDVEMNDGPTSTW